MTICNFLPLMWSRTQFKPLNHILFVTWKRLNIINICSSPNFTMYLLVGSKWGELWRSWEKFVAVQCACVEQNCTYIIIQPSLYLIFFVSVIAEWMFKGHAIYHLIYIIASQLYMHWRQETENAGCRERVHTLQSTTCGITLLGYISLVRDNWIILLLLWYLILST